MISARKYSSHQVVELRIVSAQACPDAHVIMASIWFVGKAVYVEETLYALALEIKGIDNIICWVEGVFADRGGVYRGSRQNYIARFGKVSLSVCVRVCVCVCVCTHMADISHHNRFIFL